MFSYAVFIIGHSVCLIDTDVLYDNNTVGMWESRGKAEDFIVLWVSFTLVNALTSSYINTLTLYPFYLFFLQNRVFYDAEKANY